MYVMYSCLYTYIYIHMCFHNDIDVYVCMYVCIYIYIYTSSNQFFDGQLHAVSSCHVPTACTCHARTCTCRLNMTRACAHISVRACPRTCRVCIDAWCITDLLLWKSPHTTRRLWKSRDFPPVAVKETENTHR